MKAQLHAHNAVIIQVEHWPVFLLNVLLSSALIYWAMYYSLLTFTHVVVCGIISLCRGCCHSRQLWPCASVHVCHG